jgi:hypothetical protein
LASAWGRTVELKGLFLIKRGNKLSFLISTLFLIRWSPKEITQH